MNITIAIPDELAYSINEPKQSLMQKANDHDKHRVR